MTLVCLMTVYCLVNSTNINSEEPPAQDPGDPGNSPGPGVLPPYLYDEFVTPIFDFTINDMLCCHL
ncbi:MAG: hypothetical protein JXA54_08385 [Candidatus Heimdallarchaeota archaeon]|nr:hypothetical protein [Candidatus Heimdallarchaeota archaeon]